MVLVSVFILVSHFSRVLVLMECCDPLLFAEMEECCLINGYYSIYTRYDPRIDSMASNISRQEIIDGIINHPFTHRQTTILNRSSENGGQQVTGSLLF